MNSTTPPFSMEFLTVGIPPTAGSATPEPTQTSQHQIGNVVRRNGRLIRITEIYPSGGYRGQIIGSYSESFEAALADLTANQNPQE